MNPLMTKMGKGGRIVIPVEYRRALEIAEGDDVLVALHDGEVRIQAIHGAVRRAQRIVERFVPADRDLVSELIRNRRDEAGRE